MQFLSDPSAPYWLPDDAPDVASPPIPHGSEAEAILPRLVDLWQFGLAFGAMPAPVVIGDLGSSSAKVRVRLLVPAWATHAQIYVCATGAGTVHAQEQTSGAASAHAVEIPIQGNGGSSLTEDASFVPGAATYETPTGVANRLVLLPSGSGPFYAVDLDLWKTESPSLDVWSISARFTRLDNAIP